MKIILDTNFLVYCARQKIDYKEELRIFVKGKYDLVTTNQIVDELESLKKTARKYSDKESAGLALKLLKLNKIKIIITSGKDADEGIIEINKGNYVATNDRELKRIVERPIVIKGRRKLDFG